MAEAAPLFTVSVALSLLFSSAMAFASNKTTVLAILSTEKTASRERDGLLKLMSGVPQTIELVGLNFVDDLAIAFTPENIRNCEKSKRTALFRGSGLNKNRTVAKFLVTLDNLNPDEEVYYLCVKQSGIWDFQGYDTYRQVFVQESEDLEGTIFPMPLQISVIIVILFLSGLFSGLNLGLMALDKTELQIIEKCGSPVEKKYAKIIVPLRKRGNFLLCTLLLGNVMVNSTATILLDDLSNGVVAVIVSTICIVVFGEIIPQAVCSRHGLAVGAKTHLITRFFMILTFPLSFPISLILDKILGEEIGQVYDKEKLQELIRMTADHKVLQNDEANIIAGALQLASKQVQDVMTKMEDVYMLDMDTVLDFEMMAEILKSGYTRVPVYEGDHTNIVNILNTKELALIDPDDSTAVKTVCRFYDHKPLFVDYDVRLDAMLQDFLQGSSHMAIVQKLQNEDDCDPYYQNIGVITLEDVIEEIIQNEIIDETDIMTDNRKKKLRPERTRKLEYNVFDQNKGRGPKISQQVAFAAYQFLSTAVEPFKEQYIARSVLKQLIRQNVFMTLTPASNDIKKNYLFRHGTECDYFVLLLEGHVEVEIGKENLVFESGPFNYFGVECLECLRDVKVENIKDSKDLCKLPSYIPDFSVRALTPVQYLRIRRVHYLAARRTTVMMAALHDHDSAHENTFHDVWHNTMASHISRNNSALAITDLPDTALVGLNRNRHSSDSNHLPHHTAPPSGDKDGEGEVPDLSPQGSSQDSEQQAQTVSQSGAGQLTMEDKAEDSERAQASAARTLSDSGHDAGDDVPLVETSSNRTDRAAPSKDRTANNKHILAEDQDELCPLVGE